jgi:PIN domain nuclease of toxin-antitoxin system
MATINVVDTHALLWYLAGDARLSARAKVVLRDSSREIVVPAIVVAEALFTIERGKSEVRAADVWKMLTETANVRFQSTDLEVLRKTDSLRSIPEMHDRQIVATALLLKEAGSDVVLITRDRLIRDSGLIPTLW